MSYETLISIGFSWILFAPILFLGTISMGWLVAGLIWKQTEKAWRFIAAPIVGAALASLWLDLAGRYLSWDIAVMGYWLGAAVALVYVGTRFLKFRSLIHEASIMGWGAAVVLTLLILAFVGGVADDAWHFALAAVMANGAWPVPDIFSPQEPLLYHYGFDVLVASHARVGWPVPFAADIWMGVLQASFVGAVWFIMKKSLASTRMAALATLLVLFAGNLGWILRPFRFLSPEALINIFPFHGTLLAHPLLIATYPKSRLIAMGIIMLVLGTARLRLPLSLRNAFIAAPIALAAIALSDEPIFLTLVPAILIALIFSFRGWRERLGLVAASLIGLGLAITRGGLIREVFFKLIGLGGEFGKGYTQVVLRTSPIFETATTPIDVTTLLGLVRMAIEIGAAVFLAWFAYTSWRVRREPLVRGALLGAAVAWAIPFMFVYPAYENQLARFWVPAILITTFFGAEQFVAVVRHHAARLIITIVLIFGGVMSLFLLNLVPYYWASNPDPHVYYPALWVPFFNPATRLPPGSILWADAPRKIKNVPPPLHSLPLIFGAPIQACYDILLATTSDACDNFLQNPSVQNLRALGVTHLLLTEPYVRAHEHDDWFYRLEPMTRYDVPVWAYRFPQKWWQGKDVSLLLYQVRKN